MVRTPPDSAFDRTDLAVASENYEVASVSDSSGPGRHSCCMVDDVRNARRWTVTTSSGQYAARLNIDYPEKLDRLRRSSV